MPNAKELLQGKKVILVYGPTGTGKTTLFTTIPGKKFLYIFDPGAVDTIAGLDIDYETFFGEAQLDIYSYTGDKFRQDPRRPKRKLPEPMAYYSFEEHLEKFISDSFRDYDVIGFSSLTTLQMLVLDRLLYINGRLGRQPELGDYNLVGLTLNALFTAVNAVPDKTIFIEAHSDLVQDETSKKVQNQIDTFKGIRRILPRLTTDVWVSSAEMTQKGLRYYVQTAPSRDYPACKNSLHLDFLEDVTIDFKADRSKQGVFMLFKKGQEIFKKRSS
jgi:energy-coupling factor transporter ATP-binding protein EcfA2